MIRTWVCCILLVVCGLLGWVWYRRSCLPADITGKVVRKVARYTPYGVLGLCMVGCLFGFLSRELSLRRWQDVVICAVVMLLAVFNCRSDKICEKGFLETNRGFVPWTAVQMVVKQSHGGVLLILQQDGTQGSTRTMKIPKKDAKIITELVYGSKTEVFL